MTKLYQLGFLIFVLVSFTNGIAQNNDSAHIANKLDTLKRDASYADSVHKRFNALSEIINIYRNKNVDSAKLYCDRQISLAKKSDNVKNEGIAYLGLAKIYMVEGILDSSLKYYQVSLSLHEEAGNTYSLIMTKIEIGSTFLNNGEYEKADSFFTKGLELAEEYHYTDLQATGYFYLGQLSFTKQKYQEAIKLYQKALKIYEELADDYGLSNVHSVIATIYYYTLDPDNGLFHGKLSLKHAKATGYQGPIGESSLLLANFYTLYGNYSLALEYAHQALEAFNTIGLSYGILLTNSTIAELHNENKNPQKAKEIALKGLHSDHFNNTLPQIKLLAFLHMSAIEANLQNNTNTHKYIDSARHYANLLQDAKQQDQLSLMEIGVQLNGLKNPKAALELLKKRDKNSDLNLPQNIGNELSAENLRAIALFKLGHFKKASKQVKYLLGNEMTARIPVNYTKILALNVALSARLGTPKEAIESLERYENYSDSLNRSNAVQRVEYFQEQFQNKLYKDSIQISQTQLALQEKQTALAKQRGRTQFLIAALIGLIALAAALLFYRSRQAERKQKEQEQKAKEEQEALYSELDHRVRNNMGFLISMLGIQTRTNPSPEIKEVLTNTSKRIKVFADLHNLLKTDEAGMNVNVSQYLNDLTDNYQQLIQEEGKSDVAIHRQLPAITMDGKQVFSVGLIINEWFTNAIKYAIPFAENPEIHIGVKEIGNDQLVVEFKDNGPGIDPANKREGSFGTEVVEIQVEQLRAKLETSTTNGTHYALTFKKAIK